MNGKMRGSLVVLAAGALVLTGCTATATNQGGDGGDNAGGDEIIIGAVIAETGVMNQYDLPAMAAVEMAIEDLNAEGGILGRQVRLIQEDYKSERNLAPTVAQEVINQGADALIVSCDYDFGSPAALAAQSAGLISVSLCAGSPRFGPIGGLDLGFSAGMVSQATAAAAAEWANTEQGWKTAYVLEDPTLRVDTDWANGFIDAFEHFAGEGAVLGKDTFQNSDPSINAQISKIQALPTPPEVLVISSYAPGGASALRQVRAAGIDVPVLLNDALDSTGWFDAVPDLANTWVANHAQYHGGDPSDKVNEIIDRYVEAQGDFPPSSLIVDGYIAMQMIAQGMERADSTEGEAVTAALEDGTPVETVVGPATFSETLHTAADRPVTIAALEGGEPTFAARLTASYLPEIATE
ncbi:ABC transporter substrate-binding protein [Ruicaihuangia caeni]|uniref:ABC transporter substrate-binding protein n=1 Tax=Ruicaihuangia caeni TaxID=3042517 RepID=A0AAW6T5P3_9MICO|nr:ABC transporter substrate-binding protein [Klugiella sp. YN-L-19]MDI2099097.1 ABC transporter substrate-binding protein [Klugiella sp. YN-L-19]